MTLADFFSQQQVGILIFTGVLSAIMVSNLLGMRRLGNSPKLEHQPFVSVLIPARNEARNIKPCICSLLEQDYQNYEVIVLDDQSTDETPDILGKLVAENPHLRVLTGMPLPPGWIGKNWACHQLSEQARGEYLLFVDADTRHSPQVISDVVALAVSTNVEFMSVMPRQETRSWSEVLAVPMLPWIINTLTPIPLVRALPFSFWATAIGQFILFHREAYLKSGGHSAVKDSLVEDIALSRRVKRMGLRYDIVDARTHVTTRMYHKMSELWSGYSKNLFAAFNYNLPFFVFIWLWMLLVSWHPLIGLLLAALGHPIPGFSPWLAASTVLLHMILWLVSDLRFGLPVVQSLFYPMTVLFFVAIAARSAYHHLARKPVYWKDRLVSTSQ